MQIAAGLSVAVLLGTIGWQLYRSIQGTTVSVSATPGQHGTPSAADSDLGYFEAVSAPQATSSTPEEIARIGPNVSDQLIANYAVMQRDGTYTPAAATQVGSQMASALHVSVSHPTYTPADISVTQDVSAARVVKYRKDMLRALAPLAQNTEPEFEIFAYYVNTHDPSYLAKLRTVAGEYQDAAANALKVVAPADAASIHLSLLDSMQEFGATLAVMADNADDPITAATLLETYNRAENRLRASQSAYTTYYASK